MLLPFRSLPFKHIFNDRHFGFFRLQTSVVNICGIQLRKPPIFGFHGVEERGKSVQLKTDGSAIFFYEIAQIVGRESLYVDVRCAKTFDEALEIPECVETQLIFDPTILACESKDALADLFRRFVRLAT